MVRFASLLLALCLWSAVVACSASPPTMAPSVAPSSTMSPSPSLPTELPTLATTPIPPPTRTPTPTPTSEPVDTGWRAAAPGVEWRRLSADTGAGPERLRLIRFEPRLVRLRVVYQPTHPRRVSEWATVLPNALVIVNAGYFTPDNLATGLIVSDGIAHGRSYDDFAGMLAVNPDGQVTLRWLRTWPYRPGENLAQAVQSFPVLVKPGGVMGFPSDADDGQRSRRTVVAQDISGRIVLLVGPEFRFSLHELAVWLSQSDLQLDIAVNLDGGTSTGLWIRGQEDKVDSLIPLPAIIAIEPTGG